MPKRSVLASLMFTAALAGSLSAVAQRRGGGGGFRNSTCFTNWDRENYFVSPFYSSNPLYDGRITFARIKYQGNYECGSEGPGWSHDYPRTETHFMQILKELSSIHPFVSQGAITGSILVRLDQPEIFRYPVAYLSEPGGWNLTEGALKGLQKDRAFHSSCGRHCGRPAGIMQNTLHRALIFQRAGPFFTFVAANECPLVVVLAEHGDF